MARRRNFPVLRNDASGTPLELGNTPLTTTGQFSNWQRVGDLQNLTVHVWGLVAGDIVQVEGTSDVDALNPAHADVAARIAQIGADITVDGFYRIEKGPDAIRLLLSSDAGSGAGVATASARYMGDHIRN